MASLNEGGADADAELVDGQRFLKRMNMLNSTARRLPRVEKTPVAGDWIRNERYNARPITADRYTNQDLFSPKRQFAKFTAFDPCGVDRQTLMRVTGRTPSPVKKKALRQRLGVTVSAGQRYFAVCVMSASRHGAQASAQGGAFPRRRRVAEAEANR